MVNDETDYEGWIWYGIHSLVLHNSESQSEGIACSSVRHINTRDRYMLPNNFGIVIRHRHTTYNACSQ